VLFPTAPHKILPADASNDGEREKFATAADNSSGNDEWQYWAWGFADEERREMRGLDRSVEFLGSILREQVQNPPPTQPKGIRLGFGEAIVFVCLYVWY